MECILEKLDLRFAEDLAKAIGDKRVQDNLRDGLPYPYTVKNARDFIETMLSSDESVNYIFAITVDSKFVGCISATRQSNIHSRTAEVGYYVSPEFWGNGIATQAIKFLSDFIFSNTNIIRLYAEPFSRNVASCRALTKAGFEREGTLKANAVKNGKIEDMEMYSMIKIH
jgi:RimJ/RimL family protein N-acetyltransferase